MGCSDLGLLGDCDAEPRLKPTAGLRDAFGALPLGRWLRALSASTQNAPSSVNPVSAIRPRNPPIRSSGPRNGKADATY